MITVDTHVIIWNALNPGMISKKATNAIEIANATDGIVFCEISLWEIAMLMQKKRIKIGVPYIDFIHLIKASNNYIYKGISPEIAEIATQLPSEINPDPADRIISATSLNTHTELIIADENLRNLKILRTIW